jgi:hypothetical protein
MRPIPKLRRFEIPSNRLFNHHISLPRCQAPAEVVAWLGAIQGQDYPGAVWSIGLRLPNATESAVEQAFAERKIVRTWMMRGTLHVVAAADIRWMLDLLSPRVIANTALRSQRLELDDKIFGRCRKLFTRALTGDRQLTRAAMLELLARDGISTAGARGYHILWRLAQEGLLCFGPRSGKEHTFALLDDWVKPAKPVARESALAELARRYFSSHGPAPLSDFIGWSGLKAAEARAGLDAIASKLSKETIEGVTYWMPSETAGPKAATQPAHLLPGFDEYLLGYKDRDDVLEGRHADKIVPGGNGIFLPTLVVNGRVVGTWKRVMKKKSMVITVSPFAPLKKAEKAALTQAVERHGNFIGLPAEWIVG